MKILKLTLSPSQIKALLRKDFLVRWRQPWMLFIQLIWPCIIFMLLYSIRLKYGPENIEDCQFPTRLLPTKNHVLPAFYSYICTIENKCKSTKEYEEYSKFENAPVKPIVDMVQIFINDDRLFTALTELPEKANFISAVTAIVTSGHMDVIRKNVEKVISLVPQVEKFLNGTTFDIKKLFSDRKTFVRGGYLLCGHPFPNTESIPLVNDVLYSEDFSQANQDELKVMPTPYCKRLYMDVTSTNLGKITWNTIKPIIHGKILYAPDNNDTRTIMENSNSTFEELSRLKSFSVAVFDILTKLREDEPFQKGFDSLLKLAQSPIVKSLVGDEIDIDQIQAVLQRIRTDPIIYDVISTVKNILECFSVDRFVGLNTDSELRKAAFELNNKRLFYAAVYFNDTESNNVVYKFHMDTDNTQATIENHNRFWFPGPSRNMIRDMKYHRGFVQIKHAVDMGIIKHKKLKSLEAGLLTEAPPTTNKNQITVKVINDDDDDDDDDWFTDGDKTNKTTNTTVGSNSGSDGGSKLISSFFEGLNLGGSHGSLDQLAGFASAEGLDVKKPKNSTFEFDDDKNETTTPSATNTTPSKTVRKQTEPEGLEEDALLSDIVTERDDMAVPSTRIKRQSFFDLLMNGDNANDKHSFDVDKMQFYTKQFPYPAYIHDDFKTGIYLAQAIQVAFFLGLVAEIASCVRHRIWMRESRNSMIMRSMGLKPCSEMAAWTIATFVELFVIFILVLLILYSGGILLYTSWLFVLIYLVIFGACLISFCYMCSTFFTSATIGAVATAILFFISYCPYIIVLLFDAKLNSLQNVGINISFTTAFSHGWSHIMRMELQQIGLTFEHVFKEGLSGEYGFSVFMIILDTCIYAAIGYVNQRFKDDEFRFVEVQREDLDISVGATMTDVSKIYDNNKIAVSNISLSFPRNQVTCLLGRNGAGKSTIIKMLTGQVVETSGRVILSQAMSSSKDYDKVGVCAQDNILIPNLTAREHLEMYAKIKLKHGYKSEVEKTLRSLNFGKHEKYEASQLSGGFQRRLCVAIAFIGSPNVVILDEPCNGVDAKARRDIWELIERLRKGRAVVFATHFLDEAEYLSDLIVIMKNGKVIAKHNPESLKEHCTSNYEVTMQACNSQTTEEIASTASKLLTKFITIDKKQPTEMGLEVRYDQTPYKSSEFLSYLEELQQQERISNLAIESQNLEQLFVDLDRQHISNGHSYAVDNLKPVALSKTTSFGGDVRDKPLTRWEAFRLLFWKRLVHFSRNYRMLLCVIVLPAIFELLAMWFVAYRVEDDFDKVISLSRGLYPKTTQMFSMENPTSFTSDVYAGLKGECSVDAPCKEFDDSKKAFYWILDSLSNYHGNRYGGYSFNESRSTVWYNNKGYHAMMAWLNDLNTHMLQVELNDTDYTITTYNEPWKLGFTELSTSSILRQAGDACMAFILLIAFSLVVAVASVYLVNERVKGEKLQQKLCGVNATIYWGVALVWDFLIIILAILVCVSIILAFSMPVFVARQQLWGIIALALFFGFACIPAVHVFEKCFSDASVAIVTVFCMNLIIPLFTMSIIVLLGVIGDSPSWDSWRYFLNRAFLIFPQHALGDGLLEICKNYMVANMFRRYDINSYKNPVNSDLLEPHFIALFVVGVFFMVINVLLESGMLYRWKEALCERFDCIYEKERKHLNELRIVSIQNSLKRNEKYDQPHALRVENLCKAYRSGQYAVQNVSFSVKAGECFGLLGKNGAGKSTIFKMLSGQMEPNVGVINYHGREISYCPQTNTLDSLLTVKECIEFYGQLRRINDIPKLVETILEAFQLETYCDVLVKNLSGGNRRKLTVATSCCGRTSVVLMDEPTSDMDPVTRAIVYRNINELLAEERAIVLTSHSISEIDTICHRIAVLKDGQMLTCSSPESLKHEFGGFYNVAVYCHSEKINKLREQIQKQFPQAVDLQTYVHSIKFSVRIENPSAQTKAKENGVDVPPSSLLSPLSLSQLFHDLDELKLQNPEMRFAVNRCRLDMVFERVLDSNEHIGPIGNGVNGKSAFNGSATTGYIHNGYIETET